MNEVLEEVIRDLSGWDPNFSERRFSRVYLGKCETYLAYLRSTGNEPSADAQLSLWANLKKKRQICEHG